MTRRRARSAKRRGGTTRRARGKASGLPDDDDAIRHRDATPWLSLLLAVFSFALYANTVSHDYALDDAVVITSNDLTRSGLRGIGELLTTDSFYGYFGHEVDYVSGGRYRPLSLVTFAIEHQLYGLAPHASHFLNALLYALCVVVAFRVLASLLGEERPASWRPTVGLLTALLFSAHPLHTEGVANIKGRDEILAFLLSLSALGLYVRAVDTSRPALRIVSAVIFFAALLAKESAITFVAVVPLSLFYFRPDRRGEPGRALLALAIPAVLFLLIRQSVVVSAASEAELMNDPFLEAGLGERYATVFYTLLLYLKLLVWPHPLTHDYYPYHIPIVSWSDWQAWLGLLSHALLGAAAILGFWRRNVVYYGIAFYLVTLSVASNLFFPIGVFMGERFLFTPLLGACLVLGSSVAALSGLAPGRLRPALVWTVAIALLAPMAGRTVVRNRAWKDTPTLVLTDVETSAGSAHARAAAARHLAIQALEQKDPSARARLATRALEHLDAALRIHPRYRDAWEVQAHVHSHLTNDPGRAVHAYEQVLELDPNAHEVPFKLGTLLLLHDPERLDEAVSHLEKATEQTPEDPSALKNLGAGYYEQGNTAAAVAYLERAAHMRPDDAQLLLSLAEIFEEIGEPEKHAHYRSRAERLGAVYAPE